MTLPLRDFHGVDGPQREKRPSNGNTPTPQSPTAPRPGSVPGRVRVLNVRLLVGTIASVMIIVVTISLWHRHQVRKQCDVFLAAATQAEGEEEWRQASVWLRQYLEYRPNDLDALARLAQATDKGASSRNDRLKAVVDYARILDKDPDRTSDRARMAELQLASNPESARENAEKVLSAEPENPVALRVRAIAIDAASRKQVSSGKEPKEDVASVLSAYESVLAHDPGQVNIALRVASLYLTQSREAATPEEREALVAKASQVIDAMVAGAEDKASALLVRHQYRKETLALTNPTAEKPKEIHPDLLEALKIAPDKPQVRLAIVDDLIGISPSEPLISIEADPALNKEVVAESIDHLEAALNADPKEAKGYLALSELYLKMGDSVRAIGPLEEATKQVGPLHPVVNSRLAVLYMHKERWKDADETLKRLEQCVRDARVHQEVAVANRVEAISNLLRAEWLLEEKNPERSVVRATSLLKHASETNVSSSFSAAANIRLGKCHATLKQWDLAITAFKNVLQVRPEALAPRLALAETLLQAGRLNDSVKEYKESLAILEKVPSVIDTTLVLFPLTRAQLQAQLRVPVEKRDWTEFDRNLQKLKDLGSAGYRIALLEVDAQIARASVEKRPEVVDMLKRAEHEYGEVRDFWAAAFELYLRMGEVENAEKANSRLEELTGTYNTAAQARLLLAKGDVAGAEELLRSQTSQDQGDSVAALTSLAWLGLQTGQMEQSIEPLLRIAVSQPQNVGVRYLLAQIAAQTRNIADLERWEKELRTLEGSDGSLWVFFKIQRLLLISEDGNDLALKEAAALTRQLVARRPSWPLAHAAEGMIAEALGRPNEALVAYRYAFDLGDRRPSLSRRLLGLSILKQQEAEALTHLDQLTEQSILSPEILPLATYLFLQGGETNRAVDLARRGVAALPIYSEFQVILGQALLASGHDPQTLAEAEGAFRRAVELAPGDASAWIALLHFYVTSEHPDASMRSLETLRGCTELLAGNREVPTPARQAYMIGRALQLTGDMRMANAYFRDAITEGSKRDPLLQRAGQYGVFLVKEDSAADSVWTGQLSGLPLSVRKIYGAVLLAARQSTPQILEMVSSDPRLHAVALAAQADPGTRQQAIQLMEGIPQHNRSRGDWQLLARLEKMSGNAEKAMRSFKEMSLLQPTAEQLREYAAYALDLKAYDEAREALDAIADDPGRLAETLELQIRLLSAEGKVPEALELARKFATTTPLDSDDPSVRSRLGRLAAECLAKIGEHDKGAELLREVVQDDPYGHTVLADYLSLDPKGRDEAVELCLQSANREGAVRQAWFLANILAQGSTTPELAERSEEFFNIVLKEDQRVLSSVVLSLAVLREHQGNYEEALRLTKNALKVEPGNVAHLNNLAWFLSCAGDHEKSLELIEKVIEVMGPEPAVLDTKGVALLGAQRPREAVRVLEASAESPGASPRTYLHLAEAYEALGLHEDSRRALQVASERNRGMLPPRDQKALERLKG